MGAGQGKGLHGPRTPAQVNAAYFQYLDFHELLAARRIEKLLFEDVSGDGPMDESIRIPRVHRAMADLYCKLFHAVARLITSLQPPVLDGGSMGLARASLRSATAMLGPCCFSHLDRNLQQKVLTALHLRVAQVIAANLEEDLPVHRKRKARASTDLDDE